MNIPSSVEKLHIIKDEIHTKNPRWNRLMKWWLHSLLSFRRRWLPMMRSRSSILIICVTYNSFKSCKTIYFFFFYQKLYFNVVSLFDENDKRPQFPKTSIEERDESVKYIIFHYVYAWYQWRQPRLAIFMNLDDT